MWNQDHHNHLDTNPAPNTPNNPSSPSPYWGTPSSHHSQPPPPPPPPPPPHHSHSVSHPPPPHHSQHHLNPHPATGVGGGGGGVGVGVGGAHTEELELLHQHAEQQLAAARQHQQRHQQQQRYYVMEEQERQRQYAAAAYEREVATMAAEQMGLIGGGGGDRMGGYGSMNGMGNVGSGSSSSGSGGLVRGTVREDNQLGVEILEERRHNEESPSVSRKGPTTSSFLQPSPVTKRGDMDECMGRGMLRIPDSTGKSIDHMMQSDSDDDDDEDSDDSNDRDVNGTNADRGNQQQQQQQATYGDTNERHVRRENDSKNNQKMESTPVVLADAKPKVRGKVLRKPDPPTPPTSSKSPSTSTKKRKESSSSKSSKTSKSKKKKRKLDKDSKIQPSSSSTKTKSSKSSSSTTKTKKSSTSPRRTPSTKSSSSPRRKTPSTLGTLPSNPSTPSNSTTLSNVPSSSNSVAMLDHTGSLPPIQTPTPPITDIQYTAIDALMTAFCRVPLLAEFSRPITLLHPELKPIYSKVVALPVDLGRVCRAIRRRQYTNVRAVCVDVWRIFANCVKYHTHPLTRDGAIVSFISIAMHLRAFFNELWLEFMVPSDAMGGRGREEDGREDDATEMAMGNAFEKREVVRKERTNALQQTGLSVKCLENVADAIDRFVKAKGRVDDLDEQTVLEALVSTTAFDGDGGDHQSGASEEDEEDAEEVFTALTALSAKIRVSLKNIEEEEENDDESAGTLEYTVDRLDGEVRACYDHPEGPRPPLRNAFRRRLDRLLGKVFALVLEVNGRGGNQSSIWGCMAAVIWARQSLKKPYWPALVLGIMAPDDQQEEWHGVVTARNEARLPEKLRIELQAGKRKAEQAIRRQNNGLAERMSFFLVEFLGTHEFIWVREADIIESFDPEVDPNVPAAVASGAAGNMTKKKKMSLRGQTPANERMHQAAVDEGRWALQEFEMQLSDPCGDISEEDEEDEEENYTYAVLCESDDEADLAQGGLSEEDGNMSPEIMEEIQELLATDGLLDYSSEGRKKAKKRAAALKKQQADAKREAVKIEKELKSKKAKAAKKIRDGESSKRKSLSTKSEGDLENRRLQKELEKRRKKRERDRERYLKEEERKKIKSGGENSSIVKRGRKLGIADKRGRASSIIRGYLHRIAMKDELKGLGLSGVLGIPAASVEASGLLGMTLSFRAAAGDIEMPNSNDNPSIIKPWEKINVDGPTMSKDRCINLEKQIKLLEEALVKLDKDDLRRKELTIIARKEKEEKNKVIAQAEKEARQNDMPKRKPFIRKKPRPKDENEIEDNKSKNGEEKKSEVKQESGNDSVVYETPDVKEVDSPECNEMLSTDE